MKAPDKLRITHNGDIYFDEGRMPMYPEKYLANWVKKCGIRSGEAVCVIRRDDLQRLYDELLIQRELILCA